MFDFDMIVVCYCEVLMCVDVVVVEGVGGFCVLLNDMQDIVDFVVVFGLFVVFVVGIWFGCISYVLLMVDVICQCGFVFVGWVVNYVDLVMLFVDENVVMICDWFVCEYCVLFVGCIVYMMLVVFEFVVVMFDIVVFVELLCVVWF